MNTKSQSPLKKTQTAKHNRSISGGHGKTQTAKHYRSDSEGPNKTQPKSIFASLNVIKEITGSDSKFENQAAEIEKHKKICSSLNLKIDDQDDLRAQLSMLRA